MAIRFSIVLATAILLFGLTAGSAVASPEETRQVNAFYAKLLETMRDPDANAATVARLVAANRSVAQKCVPKFKEFSTKPGKEGQGFKLLSEKTEESLLLTASQSDCSESTVEKLMAAAGRQLDNDDKIFYLENLVRLCPRVRPGMRELAELYFRERQFGMAVEVCKKSLQLKEDEESKNLMKAAEGLLAVYKQGKPIASEDVKRLFHGLMAPVPGKFGIKAEVRNAIQTNEIRFDEWSHQIKADFLPELNVVGQALKDEFQKDGGMNAKQGLLIEGHTDKRGAPEKNMELSKQRAEEIKNYLVKNFGIDPSRLKTKGYGPTKPVSPKDDDSAYALNRRVEFKKVEELPTRPSPELP
jgi:outer membrane protein OmpA-like peptidoglycan-associated protein